MEQNIGRVVALLIALILSDIQLLTYSGSIGVRWGKRGGGWGEGAHAALESISVGSLAGR
jgi:hypothetical protein